MHFPGQLSPTNTSRSLDSWCAWKRASLPTSRDSSTFLHTLTFTFLFVDFLLALLDLLLVKWVILQDEPLDQILPFRGGLEVLRHKLADFLVISQQVLGEEGRIAELAQHLVDLPDLPPHLLRTGRALHFQIFNKL